MNWRGSESKERTHIILDEDPPILINLYSITDFHSRLKSRVTFVCYLLLMITYNNNKISNVNMSHLFSRSWGCKL